MRFLYHLLILIPFHSFLSDIPSVPTIEQPDEFTESRNRLANHRLRKSMNQNQLRFQIQSPVLTDEDVEFVRSQNAYLFGSWDYYKTVTHFGSHTYLGGLGYTAERAFAFKFLTLNHTILGSYPYSPVIDFFDYYVVDCNTVFFGNPTINMTDEYIHKDWRGHSVYTRHFRDCESKAEECQRFVTHLDFNQGASHIEYKEITLRTTDKQRALVKQFRSFAGCGERMRYPDLDHRLRKLGIPADLLENPTAEEMYALRRLAQPSLKAWRNSLTLPPSLEVKKAELWDELEKIETFDYELMYFLEKHTEL